MLKIIFGIFLLLSVISCEQNGNSAYELTKCEKVTKKIFKTDKNTVDEALYNCLSSNENKIIEQEDFEDSVQVRKFLFAALLLWFLLSSLAFIVTERRRLKKLKQK